MGLTWDGDVTVTCCQNLGCIRTIPYFWNYKENTLLPIYTIFCRCEPSLRRRRVFEDWKSRP